MAFLDNSSDIILDAVLTDTGRYRMARGEFRIAKYAFSDDEIDYALYDKDNANGSSFFDVTLLQTPILEAFTNNQGSLRSKLITINRTNLLYLPKLKLNELLATKRYNNQIFVVTVDKESEDLSLGGVGQAPDGVLFGSGESGDNEKWIRVDQGLDTNGEIAPETGLPSDLRETQFMVEMDNRLGRLFSTSGRPASVSFIDDDNMATYYISATDTAFVSSINDNTSQATNRTEIINGPRGNKLEFKIRSSIDTKSSSYLFDTIGASGTTTITRPNGGGSTDAMQYIDSIIRVTGATTGYSLDIPVRYVKLA